MVCHNRALVKGLASLSVSLLHYGPFLFCFVLIFCLPPCWVDFSLVWSFYLIVRCPHSSKTGGGWGWRAVGVLAGVAAKFVGKSCNHV